MKINRLRSEQEYSRAILVFECLLMRKTTYGQKTSQDLNKVNSGQV